MGGGLVEVLKHLILQQTGVYQYLTKKFMPPGGGWRYKSKNYLRKCSGNAYLLNIIRIFGVSYDKIG